MSLRLVKLPFRLPRKQAKAVNAGLKEIAKWNPAPLDGERESWLVLNEEEPVGYLSARNDTATDEEGNRGPATAELAANFWGTGPVSAPKLLPVWVEQNLSHYDFYTARVWSYNKRIKRLLIRAGFALIDKQGKLEIYAVSRVHFLRLWEATKIVDSTEGEPERELVEA